jgi:hypothetical protein
MWSGRVSSSCSTSDTRRVNLVTNPSNQNYVFNGSCCSSSYLYVLVLYLTLWNTPYLLIRYLRNLGNDHVQLCFFSRTKILFPNFMETNWLERNKNNHLTFKECGKKGGYEEFEDTKEVIRIRISKKNRQHKEKVQKDKQLSTKHTCKFLYKMQKKEIIWFLFCLKT